MRGHLRLDLRDPGHDCLRSGLDEAFAGADVLELTLQRPNLADAFFRLTGRALRDEDGSHADGI